MSGLITVPHYMGGENLGRMDECENVNDRSPKDNHLKWRTHGIKIFTDHVFSSPSRKLLIELERRRHILSFACTKLMCYQTSQSQTTNLRF